MDIKAYPWRLIAMLAVIALTRPAIKTIADFNGTEISTTATLVITLAIAIVWIAITVIMRTKKPVQVLALAGAGYAVLSIVLAVIVRIIAPDKGDPEASIAVLLTAGLAGSMIYNIFYGALVGLIAGTLQKYHKK